MTVSLTSIVGLALVPTLLAGVAVMTREFFRGHISNGRRGA